MRYFLITIWLLFTSQIYSQYKFKIDSSFGENGILSFIDFSYAGKILLFPDAGHIYAGLKIGSNDSRKVFRYDLNGQPDYSYFNTGYFDLSFVKDSFNIGSLIIDQERAIYLSRYYGPNESRTIEVIKISPDGFLDTSFGEEGYFRTKIGTFNFVYAGITHIDSFNKLILEGSLELQRVPFILRINLDGTIDSTFASTGVRILNFSYDTDILSTHISPFGGYYFLGYSKTYGEGAVTFSVIWKINQDYPEPSPVEKFTFFPADFGSSLGYPHAIQISSDKGYFLLNKSPDYYRIHKFKANLMLDSAFATNGYFNIPKYHLFNDNYSFSGTHLASLFNGENYVFGTSTGSLDRTNIYPSMVSFTDEGDINSEFGNLGLQYFPLDDDYRFVFQEILYSGPAGELIISGRQYLKQNDSWGKPFVIKLIKTQNAIISNSDNALECEASAVPNPINNKLSINISDLNAESAKIEIYQINGYCIYRSDNVPISTGTMNLDTIALDLIPGVYFIRFQTENCKGEIKIIKH